MTTLTPYDFLSGVVSPDAVSPAATATIEYEGLQGCMDEESDCMENTWQAFFWVWDKGTGLSRVEVEAAGVDPLTGKEVEEKLMEKVQYK